MSILRRASREVYRVYSEEAYLAGAHELGEWYAPPVTGGSHERRLRRLGGAAAVTGAVGALGGVIAFMSIGARSPARQVAGSVMAPTRGVPFTGGAARASGARRARASRTGVVRHPGIVSRRVAVARSIVRVHAISAGAAHSASPRRMAGVRPASPARAIAGGPAVVYETARGAPPEVPARSRTQSEFGFER
jgi:hypothetical protein